MATGIGETLVAARRQQGVALSDAAAETRVRESYLAALEAEDFAALGGDVYVKGFLRSYARFLRLDPEPLLAAYREEYERFHTDEPTSPLAHQPVAPMPGERSPGLVIGAGVAVIVIAVLALIGLLGGDDETDPEAQLGAPPPVATTPPAAPTTAPTIAPTETVTAAPTDQPTEVLSTDTVQLQLDMQDGPSWIVVVVDGVTEVEAEQPQGTVLEFEGDQIDVTIGDAGVVNVRVNGEDRGRLGDSREVIERTYTADDAA